MLEQTPAPQPNSFAKAVACSCRACGALLGRVFADLGSSPLCQSARSAEELRQPEAFYPLIAFVCEHCLLVQSPEIVAPASIFHEYQYFSSYSDSWLANAKAYVETITDRLQLGPSSKVIELASNDGYLLQYFVAKGIPCLGVEPAANVAQVAKDRGIPTRVGFFGEKLAQELLTDGWRADLVLGNNVLAHTPDLRGFVAGIAAVLAPSGVATLEFPHLLQLIQGNQFDTIYHEHYSYFSLLAVERVFSDQGLRIFDVEEIPTHGGSLRIYACRDESGIRTEPSVARLLAKETEFGLRNMAIYDGFGERVMLTKRRLLRFLMDAKEEGKRVVGYGAPGKGNTLLNYCGVRTDLLEFTVDRSPHKQGRFLPGTMIPIYPPERIFEAKPDFVLILPWNLRNEIVRQMAAIREWGGKFVVPIPEVTILE